MTRRTLLEPFPLILLAFVGLVFMATGTGIWFLMLPSEFTARTQLYIATESPYILFPDDSHELHEVFVRRQIALIKDRFVLTAALRSPEIASLSIVQEQTDPVQWLEKEIKVESPNLELISISLSGDRPVELQKLVSAVTQSYLENVVDKERNVRTKKLDDLKKIIAKYKERSQEKRHALRQLKQENVTEQDIVLLQEQMAAREEKLVQKASEKIEAIEVEQDAPSRITVPNKDETSGKPMAMLYTLNESKRKWMKTGASALAGFGMILLVFAMFHSLRMIVELIQKGPH